LHFQVLAARGKPSLATDRFDVASDRSLDTLQGFTYVDNSLAVDLHLSSLLKVADSGLRIVRHRRFAQSAKVKSAWILAARRDRIIEPLLGGGRIASEISVHGMTVNIVEGILSPSWN
jgi:hypothetical protein